MTNRVIILIGIAGAILATCAYMALEADLAHAKIGFASGFGFSGPHPLTPHIGRLYFTPGDGSHNTQRATSAAKQLSKHRPTKAQLVCARDRAEYIARHGIATPRPLRGFSGCQKYAMDRAYWNTLPSDRLLVDPALSVTITVHNIVLPW